MYSHCRVTESFTQATVSRLRYINCARPSWNVCYHTDNHLWQKIVCLFLFLSWTWRFHDWFAFSIVIIISLHKIISYSAFDYRTVNIQTVKCKLLHSSQGLGVLALFTSNWDVGRTNTILHGDTMLYPRIQEIVTPLSNTMSAESYVKSALIHPLLMW